MRLFSLCTFVRFETMIWPSIRFDMSLQNFKNPLDSFSRQIERKRSEEYLVIILAVKESFERFSCLEFIFEKSKQREAGWKRKLKLEAWRLRIFRDTLILVFLNENCCLCICCSVTMLMFIKTLATARTTKVRTERPYSNLVQRKKFGLIFSPGPINLRWSRAIMALKCDRRWLAVFGCTYEAINSM